MQLATASRCHDALDIARAARRLRAETDLAPDDEAAQRSFGMIVGRLHARRVDKRPQGAASLQNMAASARRRGMAAIRTFLQQHLDAMAQDRHLVAERLAAQGPIPYPMPAGEHALRQRDQFIADAAGCAAPFGHLREVPQQVRPAQLPALLIHPGISAVTVRHQDAGKAFSQCRLGRLRAARGCCQEHGHALGRHQPQPVARATLLVPSLVGMDHRGSLHMGMRLGRDAGQCIADLGLALADGADRQCDTE